MSSKTHNARPRATGCTGRNDLSPLDYLVLVPRSPDDLVANEHNARTHDQRQIVKIAASIQAFGFLNPIVIYAQDRIIAGHARNEAAKHLDMASVPTIRLDHLSADQLRAYALAENRLAELAGWDRGVLADELEYLATIDTDFQVEVTGFEIAEINLLIDEQKEVAGEDPADAVAEPEAGPATSRPGDLWLLDEHRLLCGDALQEESYRAVMAGEQARMVISDCPYNVPISGHVCGLGQVQHREFAMASGEMTVDQFTTFLTTAIYLLAQATVAGGLLYMFMDWRHLHELLAAGRVNRVDLINLCVWNKTNAGMGSLYRSKHELICVFKHGSEPHINNVQLGRFGRYRTNIWDYAGVNTFRRGRMDELTAHPTAKPVALVADAIRDCTRRGDVVLDGFAGSGTIILAAERSGRRARAIEIDPGYVDVAVRRWQTLTGKDAVHGETGLTFTATAATRAADTGAVQPVATGDGPTAPMASAGMPPVRHRSRPVPAPSHTIKRRA